MESLLPLLDLISASVSKDWRDGSLCGWILDEGIPNAAALEEGNSSPVGGLSRAKKLLEPHFPKNFLCEGEESQRRFLKLSLFTAYFASVKHGWQPIKRALLKLRLPEQHLLERIFSYLLEDKWDEDLLLQMDSSALPCTSVPTTPLSRFKTKSCSPSFCYSPSSASSPASHPLKDFFSSPATTQISKYQRIAEDQKRLLSMMRLELDQEKLESMRLLKERESLSKERCDLKKALSLARENLREKMILEEGGRDDETAYEELHKRLEEKKDTDKYVGNLEEQLGESVDAREELQRTVETQRTKLEERSVLNAELDSRNIQLQVSLSLEKQLNGDLSSKVSDLEIEVRELQEILDTRRASGEQLLLPRKRGDSGAVSVADISLDDPMMSASPEGENMAEALVIPELEEQLALTAEERDALMEKVGLCQAEITHKDQEASRIATCLKQAENLKEQLKNSLDIAEKQKSDALNSLAQLQSQNAALHQEVQKLALDLSTSNAHSGALEQTNKDLQDKVTALSKSLSELQSFSSKAAESFSSQLSSLQTSHQAILQENKNLSAEIEDLKCKESNYANEALERESKIISATEEIKTLSQNNAALLNEVKSVSETMESRINELTSTVDALTSEKNELTAKNTNLQVDNTDCRKDVDALNKINNESSEEIGKLKSRNEELSVNLQNNAQAMQKLEERIQHLESCLNSLEGEKSDNLDKLQSLQHNNEELSSLIQTNETKTKDEIKELLNRNESLSSQLHTHKTESERLASELNALQVQYKSTEESSENGMKDLTLANEQLKNELKDYEERLTTSLSESQKKLAHLNEELSSKIKEKSVEVDRLVESVTMSHKTAQELTQNLNESNEEHDRTKNLLNSVNEEIATSRRTYESQIQVLKEEAKVQDTKVSSLSTQVHELGQNLLENDKEIMCLGSQLQKTSSAELELKKSVEDSELQKASQESTMSTMGESLKNYESQCKEKDDKIQKLTQDLCEMKQQISQLSSEKANAERIHVTKTSDLSHMSVDLKTVQDQLKSKITELEESKSYNASLQSELDAVNASLKTAESDASTSIEELKQALSAKGKELLSIRSGLEKELLQAKDCETAELQTTIKGLKSEMDVLEVSLKTKSAENDDLRSESQGLQSQERQLRIEMESLKEDSRKIALESKSELESLSVQIQEVSGELDIKNKTLHDLRRDYNTLTTEKTTIEATNKQLTADISKALYAVDKCEKEVTEINHSLPALENENRRLNEELSQLRLSKSDLESALKKNDEELTEYERQLVSVKDQLSKEDSFDKKLREELNNLEASLESKSQNDLASQKKRYEARVKSITESVANQYKAKLKQFSNEKDVEMKEMNRKHEDLESNYKIAKIKIAEMDSRIEELTKESEALQKKYTGSKTMILKLKEEKESNNTFSNKHHHHLDGETLRRQLAKAQTDNRQLTVQFSTAELKIRSLQKEVSLLSAQQPSHSVLSGSPPRNNVFKIPTADTPGRTRGGRTQSESHFRRPPNGVGALFNVDDEDGEMFSNSYLCDVKEGRCDVVGGGGGRLSELGRRNTLQPSHLKSSYPIETQFYGVESFEENELREGRLGGNNSEVQSITKATANLSVNSPAMNTRSRRLTIGGVQLSPLSSRKRAVLDNTSFDSNSSSFIMRYEAKRSRKEAQQTSYSKPGPPTPAKNKSFHSNSSMNESSTSEIAATCLDNTPSLRSQSPNVSNRSLRSRIVHTPLTLKRAIRRTWRKKKSYDMTKSKDENTSNVKARTPLERLDMRK